ncbi:hypothetical protein APU49_06260 [Campylobacter jejuni]|nr:hypothetical protein [Campylobacter jejuni]
MYIEEELLNYKFCFFYPHRQRISGGLQYFYGIANYIALKSEASVYVLNYRDSYINTLFDWSDKLNIIDYEDECEELDDNTIFLVYSNMLPLFLEKFSHLKKARIVIIDFHLYGWEILFNNLGIKNNIIKQNEIFQLFYENQSLAFMDYSCWENTCKKSKLEYPKKYIPAFSLNKLPDTIKRKKQQNDCIDIGYIARLDNDKIWQLINLLDNLYLLQSGKKIKVHIIGDGNSKSIIPFHHYQERFEISLCGYLTKNELNNYLLSNVDFCVAVGMAALDVAMLKIPVIIQYYSEKKFLCNEFLFLYDCFDGILGGRKETFDKLNLPINNIAQIFHKITENRDVIGEKCFQYATANHSLRYSSLNFLNMALMTKLNIETCLKLKCMKKFVQELSMMKNHGYDASDYIKIKNGKFISNIYLKIFLKKIKNFIQKRCNRKKISLNNDTVTEYKILNFITLFKTFESHKRKLFCFYIPLVDCNIPILKKVFNNNTVTFKLYALIPLFYKVINVENKYNNIQKHYEYVRQDIKKAVLLGGKIRVGFFIVEVSQYDSIVLAMEKSTIFKPCVVVIPDVARKDRMIDTMRIAYSNFSQKFQNVIMGYDEKTGEYLDYSNDFDIVFFSNPYQSMVHEKHFIWNFLNKKVLTCFQNYGFFTLIYGRTHIAQTPFYNSCWKIFVDSPENYQDLLAYQPMKAKNTFVSGYCKMDDIGNFIRTPSSRKRILLCPHHTVNMKALAISNFLRYSNFFLELPKKYPEVDFIFRPHLLLFWTLKQIWGEKLTDEYLDKMKSFSNVFYDDSKDFKQSFVDSDAIIHDCGSFTAEYLFMNKPACYMLKNEEQIQKDFLPMGQKCLENYYKAYCEDDICKFIEDVVISGYDEIAHQRADFSKKLKINFPKVGEGIVYHIKEEIMK